MDEAAHAGTALDRHIALEGAVNFRDLGGYRTLDGRTIRWRTLFRADGLSKLTRPDRDVVRQLGIATVIDLRTRAEVQLGTFPVEDIPVGFHHLPLVQQIVDRKEFALMGPTYFAQHYVDMARDAGKNIGQALSIVAQRDAHPVIVHCAAGKDRTGVLVAVILGLLGVPDETIAEDYALSLQAMEALRDRLYERHPEMRETFAATGEVLFAVLPSNILALMDGLREEFGSVEAYAAVNGAGPDVVAGLRAALLD